MSIRESVIRLLISIYNGYCAFSKYIPPLAQIFIIVAVVYSSNEWFQISSHIEDPEKSVSLILETILVIVCVTLVFDVFVKKELTEKIIQEQATRVLNGIDDRFSNVKAMIGLKETNIENIYTNRENKFFLDELKKNIKEARNSIIISGITLRSFFSNEDYIQIFQERMDKNGYIIILLPDPFSFDVIRKTLIEDNTLRKKSYSDQVEKNPTLYQESETYNDFVKTLETINKNFIENQRFKLNLIPFLPSLWMVITTEKCWYQPYIWGITTKEIKVGSSCHPSLSRRTEQNFPTFECNKGYVNDLLNFHYSELLNDDNKINAYVRIKNSEQLTAYINKLKDPEFVTEKIQAFFQSNNNFKEHLLS